MYLWKHSLQCIYAKMPDKHRLNTQQNVLLYSRCQDQPERMKHWAFNMFRLSRYSPWCWLCMSVISGMHRLRIDFYVCHWTMGKDERKMFCASHEGNVKISSKFLYHLNPYCSRPASYKTSDIGFGSLSETPVTVSLYNRRPCGWRNDFKKKNKIKK